MIKSLFSTVLLFFVLLALSQVEAKSEHAAAIHRKGNFGYHRLHEVLKIGNNPNEDIRANIFMNMEGF
jgi:hypothetical protein